ncbi:MAG: hypothetical protein ACRDV0_03160 [Acidimicrobiales bacterium]
MLTKTEIIWRHLLVGAIEYENRRSSITELSEQLGFAVSSVHGALVVPREIGAIDAVRSGLVVRDPMRLLLHWAGTRRLNRDRPVSVHTGLGVLEIQKMLPSDAVVTSAAAYARRYTNDVADYSTVYCYHEDPRAVLRSVQNGRGDVDLVVLEPDPYLRNYGDIASVPQTYVDLFVTSGWQAQRFLHRMNERLDVASAV